MTTATCGDPWMTRRSSSCPSLPLWPGRAAGGIDWAKAQSIIARCCWEVYAEKNRKGTVPTLGRVREKLLEQPEQEAKDLALYLERFTVGTQGCSPMRPMWT